MSDPVGPGTIGPSREPERDGAASPTGGPPQSEFAREAAYLEMLYERLDALRDLQRQRLAEVRLAPRGGTPQSRTERDALARHLERRLDALGIGDLPLCFGRLDLDDGSVLYVGRVGLAGEGNDPLLMDWRAPKAALFYRATSGSPEGVVRRRHFITRERRLLAIEDELLDVAALGGGAPGELHGDAALLAELSRTRTGHMRDIVATIQREQDAVIRSGLSGALVVQGGPGTGKTAVGLHRAAYLLYTHRSRLAQSGVLIIGPNPVFLRYIEQVLPALGETGALMATVRSLYPEVRATYHDIEAVADLKSRPVMAKLIANAIRDRQRTPRHDAELIFERHRLAVSRAALAQARERGRRTGRPHNDVRRIVENSVIEAALGVARRERQEGGLPALRSEEAASLRRALRQARGFREAMERLWPVLSPQQLLNDLFGSPALLRSAARGLGGFSASLLVRDRYRDPNEVPWSIEDVALLDEAAEQLGSWTGAAERRARRHAAARRRQEVDYARSVLGGLQLGIDIDPEQFAERFAETDGTNLAEQAARDRTWRFGHVIVDEAQELSPMAWRSVFRRVPSRSMTLLGDLAQCGASWAPTVWSSVLEPFARGQWRLVELSTNYRTPREIMDVANAVLAVAAPGFPPTRAIRSSGQPPTRLATTAAALEAVTSSAAATLVDELDGGRLAVLAPPPRVDALRVALAERLGTRFDAGNPLGASVALLSVAEAKGLEFDAVLLVEPGEIARHGPRGASDLYVALTRPTKRLLLLHAGALTPELEATVAPEEDLQAALRTG